MAITRISADTAQANTVTFGTGPSAGDLILCFNHRDGNNNAPALPSGYTNIVNAGANTNSARLSFKWAVGGETATPSATNATSTAALILRGARNPGFGTTGLAAGGAASSTMSYTGIQVSAQDSTSMIVLFGASRASTDVGTNVPSGATLRDSATDIAIFTKDAATTWSTATATVNGSTGWRTNSLEILAEMAAGSAPVYRSYTDVGTGGFATSAVMTKPTGVVDDDILLAYLYIETDDAVSVPSGWTQLVLCEQNGSGEAYREYCYWKRASSEGANWTWSWTSSAWRSWMVFSIAGAIPTGDPFDGSTGAVSSAADTTSENVSLTTTVPNTLLVFSGISFSPGTWSGYPGSFYERRDNGRCVAMTEQASAGSTGNVSATGTVSSYNSGMLIAIKPLPAPIAGTAAATLPKLTAAATGTFASSAITGTAAVTLGQLSAAASGTFVPVAISGTGAAALDALTASAAGTFAAPVFAGTAAASLESLTAAVSGTFVPAAISGTAAATLANLSAAASGTYVPAAISGTAAATLETLVASASGPFDVPIFAGTAAATLASPIIGASGTFVPAAITGTASAELSGLTAAASGTFVPAEISGTVAATLESLTASAAGVFIPEAIAGTASATLGLLTAAATGTFVPAAITGSADATLASISAAATGAFVPAAISGTASATLETLTSAATGTFVPAGITGTVAATIAALAATGTGIFVPAAITGTCVAVLGGDTLTPEEVEAAVLDAVVEGSLSVREALRLLLAVAAGQSEITDLGGGAAEVVFRDTTDATDRVTATMAGSERTNVVLDPS